MTPQGSSALKGQSGVLLMQIAGNTLRPVALLMQIAGNTPKIQCEIIEKQLQHRRDCYARTLKEGALHSSHKGGSVTKLTKLLELFKGVLADEKETPGLLEPPQISQVYKQHAFGTNLRKSLGKVQLLICHVHPHSLPCS
jgi:hypothetical protein